MRKLGKVVMVGAVLLLTGCSDKETREEPLIIAEAETVTDEVNPKKEERLDRTEMWITGFEQEDKEIAPEYLGEIELEDYNPDLPTQRREGSYKPGKLEDGVWYWEFESKEDKDIPTQRLPFDKQANL